MSIKSLVVLCLCYLFHILHAFNCIFQFVYVLESGKLFSFGGNGDGQLGHGDRNVSIFRSSQWISTMYNLHKEKLNKVLNGSLCKPLQRWVFDIFYFCTLQTVFNASSTYSLANFCDNFNVFLCSSFRMRIHRNKLRNWNQSSWKKFLVVQITLLHWQVLIALFYCTSYRS